MKVESWQLTVIVNEKEKGISKEQIRKKIDFL